LRPPKKKAGLEPTESFEFTRSVVDATVLIDFFIGITFAVGFIN
jgi:hypothetical protein